MSSTNPHAHRFTGSMVALVTPMHENGAIDYEALEQLIEWQIEAGTDGLIIAGTTGESATLDAKELYDLIKFCVGVSAKRIPIVGGSGSNATLKTIELSKLVEHAGADACLVVSPYYNKPTQAGLVKHYWTVADSVNIPVILYNVPGRTACDMQIETTLRLAEHPNIVAIKEANASAARINEITYQAKDQITLLSGDDATCVDFMLKGGHGFISVTANVAPQQMKLIATAALAGDAEKAKALDAEIASLHRDLFVESNPSPAKWALETMGKIKSGIRLPLLELSAEAQVIVKKSLEQAKILD